MHMCGMASDNWISQIISQGSESMPFISFENSGVTPSSMYCGWPSIPTRLGMQVRVMSLLTGQSRSMEKKLWH